MGEPAIKNIIFDLGGVFLDVDYNKTKQAFIDLGIANFNDFYQQSYSDPLFARLEKGLIETDDFYNSFREITGSHLTNKQIATAWNAMMGSFRKCSVAILPGLKNRYNTYLLSNINDIHYRNFGQIFDREFGAGNFDDNFHKTYYSHLFHHRKPDAEAYEYVVRENGLVREATLFVDDTMKNIVAAADAGLRTLFLPKDTLVETLLMEYVAF
ncbi:MAG: HAD family phosphatase [Chitinophagaceae bacterium]